MKTAGKALLALVLALVVTTLMQRLLYMSVGQQVLKTAGWTPGAAPPLSYALLTIAVSFIAALMAGAGVALVMERSRTHYAALCGLLLTAYTAVRFRDVLFPPKYFDAWPVALSTLIFMPVGAWLMERLLEKSRRSRLT